MGITTLNVSSNGSTYPVHIGAGLLTTDLPRFALEREFTRTVIFTHDELADHYADALAARMPRGVVVTIPAGERYKTTEMVSRLYDRLVDAEADRSTLVVALGGGVIGDMGGFAAATFMRGLPLVQCPTSLLAMVDSSIGGKVGVDLNQGKNLVGVFKDPIAVFADTDTLATLPDPEYRCGLAEIIKAALVGDPPLLDAIAEQGSPDVAAMIARAATVKIGIVEQDPFETGIRAHLNLGHTFAHAFEQVSGYGWRHGEAVAVGLAAAARLSERLKLCPDGVAARVEQVLAANHLPFRYSGMTPDDLLSAMHHDKKWRDKKARFILLNDIGQPVIAEGVDLDTVRQILFDLH